MAIQKQPGRPQIPLAQRHMQVYVGLTYKEIEHLEAMADELGMTRPNLLRKIVIRYLNKK